MRGRYTPAALAHLREIGDYTARDNREAAKRVIQAIRNAVELLRDNPDMGRRGHLEDTREMVIPRQPYFASIFVGSTSSDHPNDRATLQICRYF
jgi:plasmid stabilization system protein ParE